MPGGSRCSVEELTDFRFRVFSQVFSASPIVSMVSPRWAGGRGGAEEQRCSVGDDHLLGRSPQECLREQHRCLEAQCFTYLRITAAQINHVCLLSFRPASVERKPLELSTLTDGYQIRIWASTSNTPDPKRLRLPPTFLGRSRSAPLVINLGRWMMNKRRKNC